ncbi:DUF5412 domain-containing protein [Neobacillus sp.]|uniref:DUF5412 domain-containing protein n=1 Tax=Neobacillus sp. TaxID=2675273 RepID=UPI00289D41A6|nr:DUF5412 domain-containing protein [Neobacillus sp.]
MKKKQIITLVILIPLLSFGLIGYGVYWAFFDMNRLPQGDLISEMDSPDGTWTIKAYVSSGGATVGDAVRGELNFNKEKRKPKNIYWNYREYSASINWINNNTVEINGHKLSVPDDTFDFRR